jgi:hypothetical protein
VREEEKGGGEHMKRALKKGGAESAGEESESHVRIKAYVVIPITTRLRLRAALINLDFSFERRESSYRKLKPYG